MPDKINCVPKLYIYSLRSLVRKWYICVTISIDVHRTVVSLAVVVGVYLGRVVLIGAVVAAVAHLILVEVKLARVVKQAAVVLLWKDSGCQFEPFERNEKQSNSTCATVSSGIPSLSSSLSQASP